MTRGRMIAEVDPGVDLADQETAAATSAGTLTGRNRATRSGPAGSSGSSKVGARTQASARTKSGVLPMTEMMEFGKPIVASDLLYSRETTAGYSKMVCVNPASTDEILAAARAAATDPERYGHLPRSRTNRLYADRRRSGMSVSNASHQRRQIMRVAHGVSCQRYLS